MLLEIESTREELITAQNQAMDTDINVNDIDATVDEKKESSYDMNSSSLEDMDEEIGRVNKKDPEKDETEPKPYEEKNENSISTLQTKLNELEKFVSFITSYKQWSEYEFSTLT